MYKSLQSNYSRFKVLFMVPCILNFRNMSGLNRNILNLACTCHNLLNGRALKSQS